MSKFLARVLLFFACFLLAPTSSHLTFAKKAQEKDSGSNASYRKNYNYSNDIYIGVGFSMTGIAAKTASGDIISNGFIASNPFLGTELRIGYQYVGKIFYFAVEAFGGGYFGINDGLIGSSGGHSLTVTTPGKGTFFVGLNIKPGISFNQRRGSIYLIVGAMYNWLSGSYSNSTGTQQFSMDGFGLNYGIGIKHNLNDFVAIFLEFNGLAPIVGSGAFNLDRTPVSNGARFGEIISLETYTLSIGVDILM